MPAFAWWVPHTLRKRDRILKAMKKRYFRREQKYGIELPKTIKRALEIDKETGTNFWRNALRKEMDAIKGAFNILEEGATPPPGYKHLTCHCVFSVKADFSRKVRFCADGHKLEQTSAPTYASVVSRESVRILFTIASLNNLDVMAADISNAYLNAPCAEKLWIR